MLYPLLELIVLSTPINIKYFTKLYKISKKINWWHFAKQNSQQLFSHARYKLVFDACYESRITIYGDKLPSSVKIEIFIEGKSQAIQKLSITQVANYIKPYRTRLDKSVLSQFIQIIKKINKSILYQFIRSN
jgi:hypothetical protein